MALRIAVCAKQVPDPETPPSAFKVDEAAMRVIPTMEAPPVINGFDMQALEASLRLRDEADAQEVNITVFSSGPRFSLDAMKNALALGADRLVLIEDPALEDLDGMNTARVLTAALNKEGPFDLVLCGRQASDWDQGYVPFVMSELLEVPCISFARAIVRAGDRQVRVERVLTDGYQVLETPLPAVVSVSNELGEPRFPTLRGIMAASKVTPDTLNLADIGIDASELTPELNLRRLYAPEVDRRCEFVEGTDEADAGRKLAYRLRELELI